jgi:hypothetical protein
MDESGLQSLKRIQLHHARLLFIITELHLKNLITEDQKLSLKFGVLTDD